MMGFKFFSQGEELSADVSPASLSKSGPNGPLTSNSATATASGGKSPFTYAWSRVSGDVFTINGPTSSVVDFTGSGTDEVKTGVYKCVITDDNSDTAEDTVTVTFTFGTPP